MAINNDDYVIPPDNPMPDMIGEPVNPLGDLEALPVSMDRDMEVQKVEDDRQERVQAEHMRQAKGTISGPNWGLMLGQALSAGLVGGLDTITGKDNLSGVLEQQQAALKRYNDMLSRVKKYDLFLLQNPESAETIAKLGGVDALARMNDADAAEAFKGIKDAQDVSSQLEWMRKSGYWSSIQMGAFESAKDPQQLGFMVQMYDREERREAEERRESLDILNKSLTYEMNLISELTANPPTNLGPQGIASWRAEQIALAKQMTATAFGGINSSNPIVGNYGPNNREFARAVEQHNSLINAGQAASEAQAFAVRTEETKTLSADKYYDMWENGQLGSGDRKIAEGELQKDPVHLNRVANANAAQVAYEGLDALKKQGVSEKDKVLVSEWFNLSGLGELTDAEREAISTAGGMGWRDSNKRQHFITASAKLKNMTSFPLETTMKALREREAFKARLTSSMNNLLNNDLAPGFGFHHAEAVINDNKNWGLDYKSGQITGIPPSLEDAFIKDFESLGLTDTLFLLEEPLLSDNMMEGVKKKLQQEINNRTARGIGLATEAVEDLQNQTNQNSEMYAQAASKTVGSFNTQEPEAVTRPDVGIKDLIETGPTLTGGTKVIGGQLLDAISIIGTEMRYLSNASTEELEGHGFTPEEIGILQSLSVGATDNPWFNELNRLDWYEGANNDDYVLAKRLNQAVNFINNSDFIPTPFVGQSMWSDPLSPARGYQIDRMHGGTPADVSNIKKYMLNSLRGNKLYTLIADPELLPKFDSDGNVINADLWDLASGRFIPSGDKTNDHQIIAANLQATNDLMHLSIKNISPRTAWMVDESLKSLETWESANPNQPLSTAKQLSKEKLTKAKGNIQAVESLYKKIRNLDSPMNRDMILGNTVKSKEFTAADFLRPGGLQANLHAGVDTLWADFDAPQTPGAPPAPMAGGAFSERTPVNMDPQTRVLITEELRDAMETAGTGDVTGVVDYMNTYFTQVIRPSLPPAEQEAFDHWLESTQEEREATIEAVYKQVEGLELTTAAKVMRDLTGKGFPDSEIAKLNAGWETLMQDPENVGNRAMVHPSRQLAIRASLGTGFGFWENRGIYEQTDKKYQPKERPQIKSTFKPTQLQSMNGELITANNETDLADLIIMGYKPVRKDNNE